MTKRAPEHWTCPHGFVTGFFPVPGHPHLIEHRSCGICCDEISEIISPTLSRPGERHNPVGSKYRYDRYVDGRLMAQGVTVSSAESEIEAREKAYAILRADGATEDEISRTTFRVTED